MHVSSRRLLWGILLLAVALRVPTLDVQSYWADEAATVDVLRHDLGGVFTAVGEQESTPPLYYVLAWFWTQVVGDGEFALRSLSALFGVLTVPVAGAVGVRCAGLRGGSYAAVLVATSPLLVWFSQEARAYALLAFLATLSVLAVMRAAEDPTSARLLAWGLATAAMLATHFFALFAVIGEAAWLALVLQGRVRSLLTAAALPALTAVALLPLALDQRSAGRAGFISEDSLTRRIAQLPKQFLVGYDAPLELLAAVFSAVAVAVALVALASPGGGRKAMVGAPLLAVVGAVLLPLALALAGEDYLVTRNVISALPLVLVLVAAGCAAAGSRPGAALAVLLAAIGIGVTTAVAATPGLQRENWREGAAALHTGDSTQAVRAVIVRPGSGIGAVSLYLPGSVPMRHPALVGRIDVLAVRGHRSQQGATDALLEEPPLPGFDRGVSGSGADWAIQRFVRSGDPVLADPAALIAAAPGAAVLLEGAPAAGAGR